MSSHFKLKAIVEGSEVVGESLELTGNKSFKVFPVEKNTTQSPIRGSAVVSILSKNHSISLTHKINDLPDPDPSATKYSYVMNLYTSGSTPVPAADKENQDTAYIMASRGKTTYGSTNLATQKIIISDAYTTQAAVRAAVGDFSSYSGGVEYNKGAIMTLFTFVMYYKFAEEVSGVVVPPPVPDEDTPESHRKRIPCRPSANVNDWIVNSSIGYIVEFKTDSAGAWQRRFFNTWADFIAFWDSICTNTTDYYDMVFYYIFQGTVQFNESSNERVGPITVTEIDNGKGEGIHGARNLYLVPAQQKGRNIYGAAIIPASASSLDSQGMWSFGDMNEYTIQQNKLTAESSGTFRYKPKFRIKSSSSYYARSIAVITNGSVITNPDGAGTVDYQYIGQPFILRLYKENANGISKQSMRPYYKLTPTSSPLGTEYWKDSNQIMGAQNFNPIQYDQWSGEFYYLHLRDSGYRGFISGPISGDHGMCIFQLIPICFYSWTGDQYTTRDYIDGEGGVGTKGVNYVNRYTRYESAIGGADTPGQNSTDKYKAAFLKWPNEDDNNAPDHICPTGVIESLLSQMGKNWENWIQDFGDYKYIDRVMFAPVLWTQKRLEEDAGLRTYLSQPRFGYYLLSPWVPDAELDNTPDAIYRIGIDGLDIQIQ